MRIYNKLIVALLYILTSNLCAYQESLIVSTKKLNVRSTPNGHKLDSLFIGQQVSVTQRKGLWLRINYELDKYGWVHVSYIKPTKFYNYVNIPFIAKRNTCSRINNKFYQISWKNISCSPKDWLVGGYSNNGFALLYQVLKARTPNNYKAATILVCSVHSDENTAYQCFKLLELLKNNPHLLNHTLVLVPLLNPDGFLSDMATRTNASGVDLNRNLPTYNWHNNKKYNTRKRYFPGKTPNSEPENQFLISLIQYYKPDKIISVHAPLNFIDLDLDKVANNDLNYKAKKLALQLAKNSSLKFRDFKAYPGSLGTYGSNQLSIPVYTIELPTIDPTKSENIFKRLKHSLALSFKVILNSK